MTRGREFASWVRSLEHLLVGVIVAWVAEADARDGRVLELDWQPVANGIWMVLRERCFAVRVLERVLGCAASRERTFKSSASVTCNLRMRMRTRVCMCNVHVRLSHKRRRSYCHAHTW